MTIQQRQGSSAVNVSVEHFTPEQVLRLMRLAQELRLTDQILSIDVDRVTVVAEQGRAPAWTSGSGEAISFNAVKMPDPKDRHALAVWLGTNAHELGHVMFSPRSDSPLMRRVRSGEETFLRGLHKLWNIVEDQRQERLLLVRFSPWAGYLVAALGHHLSADNASAWLLMAGRTWLPASVRAEARRQFVAHRGEAVAVKVAELIGDYQRLTDPGDAQQRDAWEVLEELHRLFEGEIPEGGGCGGGEIGEGEPVTVEPDGATPFPTADEADDDEDDESESDADESDESDEPQSDGDPCDDGEPQDESDEGDGGNRDRQPDDSQGDDDDSSESGESEGDESDSDAQGDGEAEPLDGTSDQSGPPTRRSQQSDWRERLSDAADEQIDDEQTSDELDSILDALEHGRGSDTAEGPDAPGRYVPASDSARRLHRDIADALVDFKDASEPGWVKRTNSGRLNVARLADPYADADELFDRYEPGALDASELEAVLLLDVSSSMHSQTAKLGEATWAIRQAVDDLEGTLTVLTYENGHYVLARPGQRPDDRMYVPQSLGGTDPESALNEAWRIIAGSEARNRLMVVMTDGQWEGEVVRNAAGRAIMSSVRSDALIEAMRNAGVATVMAFVPPPYGSENVEVPMHGCEFGGRIESLDDLPRLFQRVALAQMQADFR